MKIPKPLQNKAFRFIKTRAQEPKKALEEGWRLSFNYKYNESELKEYLAQAKSYGVVCGFGNLAVVDCDTKEVEEVCSRELPPTLKVRTGSGGCHLYYIVDNLDRQHKLIDKHEVHHGEIQSFGQYVIGPGSVHPNGNKYHIEEDNPIATIDRPQLLAALSEYIKKKDVEYCTTNVKFPIEEVAKHIRGLSKKGRELVGAHPVHGSEGGENFHIDTEKGVWHCFRCGSGGDAFTLIALLEGLLSCSECKSGALSGELFKKTVKIAEEKYGYEEEKVETSTLTVEQKKALSQRDLVFRILQETHKEGVIGNELAQLAMIMKISLRYVLNANNTSSNLLVSDETGGGKDWVTTNLCKVMLTKYKTLFKATGVSEKVLNYWEPEGKNSSWDGRVLYLEDPEANTLTSQAFKVRASGNNEIATLDTERNVVYKKINGKPVLIVTSLKQSIDIELMRRWDAVQVDTSDKVTKACTSYVTKKNAGLIEYNPDMDLREGLRNLPFVEVIVPFAPKLAPYLPSHLIMRSQTPKLMDYIKASAALHQLMRKKDEHGRVIAELDDYVFAAYIFDMLGSVEGQALNKAEKALVDYLWDKQEPVPLSDILTDIPRISQTWLYRAKDNLGERGVVKSLKQFSPRANGEVWHMQINEDYKIEFNLPDVKKLGEYDGYFKEELWKDITELRKKEKLPEVNYATKNL